MRPPKFLTTFELYQSNHCFSVAHTFLAGRLKVSTSEGFSEGSHAAARANWASRLVSTKNWKEYIPKNIPYSRYWSRMWRHSTKNKHLQTFAFHSSCLFDVFQTAGIATVGSVLIERSTGHILETSGWATVGTFGIHEVHWADAVRCLLGDQQTILNQ